MSEIKIDKTPEPLSKELLRDYMMLSKFRLSTTVVGTAILGYILAVNKLPIEFSWLKLFGITVGGMMVVASANGFNQVIEKDRDKLMSRTMNRPVANGRLSVKDALTFSAVCGVIGLFTLLFMVNSRAALLGLLSIFSYVLAYTPLKPVTPFAVFVGAIPGAIPPAIGWVAGSGNIETVAIFLFVIQLFWQFPHFWAIAWMLDDDYRRAGYTLLPNYEGRTRGNADKILIYSLFLLIVSCYPIFIKFSSVYSLVLVLPAGLYLIYAAYQLRKTLEIAEAKKLMFASLIFMPVVLISYLFPVAEAVETVMNLKSFIIIT